MSRPFRFGVQSYAPASGAQFREQVRQAEALGYSVFNLADHVLGPGPALKAMNHPVQTVAAVPAMAVAAEVSTTIKIGCRVFCCDYRNPAIFVKELATLDFFSEGRLEIGLGAGWLQGEYEAIGVPFLPAGQRIDRLEETIALMRASFAEGELSVEGTHVRAVGFEAVPKPVQAHPPLMIGGGARRVLGVAGREADIVSINFNNSAGKIGAEGVGSGTADGTAQKLAWVRDGAGDRYDDIELEIAAYFTIVTDDAAKANAQMAGMFGLEPEQFAEHPHALIGSLDAMCEKLEARRERYGISYVTVGASVMEAFSPVVARLSGT